MLLQVLNKCSGFGGGLQPDSLSKVRMLSSAFHNWLVLNKTMNVTLQSDADVYLSHERIVNKCMTGKFLVPLLPFNFL
jgi:hypothetical protein